jgi:hypothetical protein
MDPWRALSWRHARLGWKVTIPLSLDSGQYYGLARQNQYWYTANYYYSIDGSKSVYARRDGPKPKLEQARSAVVELDFCAAAGKLEAGKGDDGEELGNATVIPVAS